MKKSTRTIAPKKTTRTSTPSSIPPLASAVALLMDTHAGESAEFARAYAQMPALIAHIEQGDEDHRWDVIRTLSGLTEAELRAAKEGVRATHSDGREHRMAYAVGTLNREDEDLITDLATPLMDAAMFVGIAFACYVLLGAKGGAQPS